MARQIDGQRDEWMDTQQDRQQTYKQQDRQTVARQKEELQLTLLLTAACCASLSLSNPTLYFSSISLSLVISSSDTPNSHV